MYDQYQMEYQKKVSVFIELVLILLMGSIVTSSKDLLNLFAIVISFLFVDFVGVGRNEKYAGAFPSFYNRLRPVYENFFSIIVAIQEKRFFFS